MTSDHVRYDICINGAGPLGMCTAIHASLAGLKVLLIERRDIFNVPPEAIEGRTYALNAQIRPLFERLGIWENLDACPIDFIRILESDAPDLKRVNEKFKQKVRFDLDAFETNDNEPLGWLVEACSLSDALQKRIREMDNIEIHTGTTAEFVRTQENVEIKLNDGKTRTAKLLLAVDGRGSSLRRDADIGLTKIPYDKHALVTIITHSEPHLSSALEHFLPNGPFARLPLTDKDGAHRSAIVWTDKPAQIEKAAKLNDATFIRALELRLPEENLGEILSVGKKWVYPLSSQYAHRFIDTRLALMGDGAHGLHPVAAQGLNAGFIDYEIITDLIEKAIAENEDIGSDALLNAYQAASRPRTLSLLAFCDGLERVFSARNFALKSLRRAGLKIFSKAPALRKKFVQAILE